MDRSLNFKTDAARRFASAPARFIGAQRRRLFNLGIAGSASVIVALASLVTLALNVRGLGAEQFGVFVAIQAYVALCASVCTVESWQSVCRLGLERGVDLGRLCKQTLMLDALAALAAFALAVGGVLLLGRFTGIAAEHLDLALIHSLSLLAGLSGTARGYFRLKDRFDLIAANQVFYAVALVLASIALLASSATLTTYIIVFTCLAAAYKLQLLAHMWWHSRIERMDRPGASRRTRFGEVARMSASVSVLGTVVNARRNVAILMVSAILGPLATGLFAAALKCTAPLVRLGELLKQVLFTDTIRAFGGAKLPRARVRKLRFLVVGMLAAILAAMALAGFLAGPLLALFLGPEFADAVPILVVLLLAEGLQLAATIFSPLFQARGRTNLLTAIHFAGLAAFVGSALLLRETIDATGIAWLLLAAFGMSYLVQLALVLSPGGLLFAREHAR